jgi:hypothetical protein
MQHPSMIENIEEMRQREGIDDVELREAIRGLCVGDCVWLTFLTDGQPFSGEMIRIAITRIRGRKFQGKLTRGPTSPRLSHLRRGDLVSFTADHIHSLANGPTQKP